MSISPNNQPVNPTNNPPSNPTIYNLFSPYSPTPPTPPMTSFLQWAMSFLGINNNPNAPTPIVPNLPPNSPLVQQGVAQTQTQFQVLTQGSPNPNPAPLSAPPPAPLLPPVAYATPINSPVSSPSPAGSSGPTNQLIYTSTSTNFTPAQLQSLVSAYQTLGSFVQGTQLGNLGIPFPDRNRDIPRAEIEQAVATLNNLLPPDSNLRVSLRDVLTNEGNIESGRVYFERFRNFLRSQGAAV